MGFYTVRSGSLKASVRAINHKTAAIVAINDHNPKELGHIISVLEYGEYQDKEVFLSTARVLEAMNMPIEKKKDI